MKILVAVLGVLLCSVDTRAEDAAAASAPVAGIAGCGVDRPAGDYAMLRLEVHLPGDPEARRSPAEHERTWAWIGGGRDGRFPVENGVGVTQPGGVLTARDGRLTGEVLRVTRSANRQGFVFVHDQPKELTLTVDAAVDDAGEITGTCRVAGVTAKVSGRIIPEAELARANAVPRDKGWPWLQGPPMHALMAEPTDSTLTDELSGIRRVWRLEEIDIGAGMGSISRGMQRWGDASDFRTCTGGASVIAADGKVFVSYYVPAPREEGQPLLGNPTTRGNEETLLKEMRDAAKADGFDTVPVYAAEKVWQNVNDIVVCADAATGKTLWKAVVKKRPTEGVSLPPGRANAPNYQHHKLGPFNRSPAYANGRVYALSMTNVLMAFDAETGEPLWEQPVRAGLAEAVLAVDDIVIAPSGQWTAFDGATGKKLWSAGNVTACTLVPWKHEGRTYVIGRVREFTDRNPDQPGLVACFDATTGERVWQVEANVVSSGRGGGGAGGISIFGDTMLLNRNDAQEPPSGRDATYVPTLAAYKLSPAGAKEMWTVGGVERKAAYGSVLNPIHYNSAPPVVRGKYVFTPNLNTIDLGTGRTVGEVEGDTPVDDPNATFVGSRFAVPRNGGHMMSLGSLVLVRVDGTHGRIRSGWYHIGDDGSISLLNKVDPDRGVIDWHPPGPETTSYHNPLYYAIVDGRLFMRQENGVYCYDLRVSAEGTPD